MKSTAVILAAGQGTRMKSSTPKILHPLAGQPMITYPVEAATRATSEIPVVVVGHQADEVRAALGEACRFVVQAEQLGTGHAVQQAEDQLAGQTDLVLVINGDLPLLTGDTLDRLVLTQTTGRAAFTMLTRLTDQSRGFGRVVRDTSGEVMKIVEESQATPEQLAIRELNVGAYCFAADWLWEALRGIKVSPKGEFFLTDLVEIAFEGGDRVQGIPIEDPSEALGINNRVHLAEVEAALRRRINRRWMEAGVTMIDPESTYIDARATIGEDTEIWPNTYLLGDTAIGEGCRIGPNSYVVDSKIGDRCIVLASFMEGARLENDVDIGPFARLRKGAHLKDGVHMGNFGEVKNSVLGPGTKVGHFSYIGDATIGPRVNIGAGTITCNYDGKNKFHTEIEEGAFIGSDTMLVAPVKLGKGANTGAGAVVTKDIPAHTLAAGVPARVIRKLDEDD
ncbi:MAG: bifunctional UDP-N-acetylglucosamine diphosphorylase/glucosamine-1-phosphate N-acetyltransferase GlmU [Anaerolineales bacterium]|nr:bifunctional UDP-N-acetylglucosamine diphosphorylase/glucosamine-1-phosphate N-acetyltransferase GlmU [Anaerolineales bacterium]